MGNYIGKLTQCTLDSTGIVNKYHVFFSVCDETVTSWKIVPEYKRIKIDIKFLSKLESRGIKIA